MKFTQFLHRMRIILNTQIKKAKPNAEGYSFMVAKGFSWRAKDNNWVLV